MHSQMNLHSNSHYLFIRQGHSLALCEADEDVHNMYEEYNNKHQKDIMQWFYAGDTTHKSTKQKRSLSWSSKYHSTQERSMYKTVQPWNSIQDQQQWYKSGRMGLALNQDMQYIFIALSA